MEKNLPTDSVLPFMQTDYVMLYRHLLTDCPMGQLKLIEKYKPNLAKSLLIEDPSYHIHLHKFSPQIHGSPYGVPSKNTKHPHLPIDLSRQRKHLLVFMSANKQ